MDEFYQPPKSQERRKEWESLRVRYGPKDKRLRKGEDKRKKKAWLEWEKGLISDALSAIVVSSSSSNTTKEKGTNGSTRSRKTLFRRYLAL